MMPFSMETRIEGCAVGPGNIPAGPGPDLVPQPSRQHPPGGFDENTTERRQILVARLRYEMMTVTRGNIEIRPRTEE